MVALGCFCYRTFFWSIECILLKVDSECYVYFLFLSPIEIANCFYIVQEDIHPSV